ncbi:somatostatin receptor type 4-like [Glandiceps talaboti]
MTTAVTLQMPNTTIVDCGGNSSDACVVQPSRPVCPFADEDVMFIFYAVSCAIALFGNLTFLVVVIKVKSMRTMPNFFFINLSVADTLFMVYYTVFLTAKKLMIMPILMFHAKGGNAITDVGFCVSMLTVALISLNRYIAICYPFKAEKLKLQSTSRVIASIAGVWVFGIALAIFDALIYSSNQQKTLFTVLIILLFISITLSIVVVVTTYLVIAKKMLNKKPRYAPAGCNSNSRISEEFHVLLLCVAITVIFFISASPMASVYIVVFFSTILGDSPIDRNRLACLAYVANLMLSLHFTLNPILYNIGSRNHRAAFSKVFCFRRPKILRRRNSNTREPSPINSSNISMTMSTYAEKSVVLNNHC